MIAVEQEETGIVSLLLSYGADTSIKDAQGSTCLSYGRDPIIKKIIKGPRPVYEGGDMYDPIVRPVEDTEGSTTMDVNSVKSDDQPYDKDEMSIDKEFFNQTEYNSDDEFQEPEFDEDEIENVRNKFM